MTAFCSKMFCARRSPNMELRLAQAKLNSLSGAVVDPTKIVAPTTDGDRVAYAQALMSAGRKAQ